MKTMIASAMAIALLVAGCTGGQDPGIEPVDSGGPSTTSNTIGSCPPGGPDADNRICLDSDGTVLRFGE